ncbi:uncharacterized protein BXZ73DRAFT_49804 [Epithele typhae]|uniref:uncharacterized protein n=1 Tax=Epithele typhae TaxID=378194 RepID=UPI002008607D|nr:uncharacterized protein BXZ73DRAFT_49804 [Epithele typhae]KAH9925659.1 hypothetical protein BXZ73DRAFT_49804 [Epithele typhae]
MVKFDDRAITAVVQIVLYIPVLIVALVFCFRYGFNKHGGWMGLAFFLSVRLFSSPSLPSSPEMPVVITAGILAIVSTQDISNHTLAAVYPVLESAGLSPLMGAITGFLSIVCQFTLAKRSFMFDRGLVVLQAITTLAFVLLAYSASALPNAKNQDDIDQATSFRQGAYAVLAGVYIALVWIVFSAYMRRAEILKYRRQLLTGVLLSLPFVTARVVYSIVGGFAKPTFGFDADGNLIPIPHPDDPLQKFNPTTGNFVLFVACALATQYVAVMIICFVGMRTPLKKDEVRGDVQRWSGGR